MFRFKVCCIKSVEEATLAIQHGASILGLVGQMPSGPGPISIDLIKEIAAHVKGDVVTWILSSKTKAQELIDEYQYVQTDGIQLVDEVRENDCKQLKERFPDLYLVQVRHVEKRSSAATLASVNRYIDAILLDSGSPNNEIKILGGTGNVHDWHISESIVALAKVPVFLAGGLNPSNAVNAIELVKPYGLDVCSGLRSNDKLDVLKLHNWSRRLDDF